MVPKRTKKSFVCIKCSMYSVESRPIWPIGTSFVLFEACICRSDVPAPDSYALGGLTRTRTLMVTSFFVASGHLGCEILCRIVESISSLEER